MPFNILKKLAVIFIPVLIFSSIKYEEPWGKDSDLILSSEETYNPKESNKNIITKIADSIITFKQKVISPVDGPRSHFRPTSSRYMQLAMYRYGFFKGYIMGCDRLLRENNEKWVYRTITIENIKYKYDPAVINKYFR